MKRVKIIATGRPIEYELCGKIDDLIRSSNANISVEFDPLCFTKTGHFAGTDEDRARVLQKALSGSTCDAVWLARGGYGTGRLLSRINWRRVDKNVGVYAYSDGCFLLSALFGLGASNIFHAPMPIDINRAGNESHMNRVVRCIETGNSDKKIKARFIRGGRCAYDKVYAANLTVLTKLIGTRYEPRLDDGLLIIEDVGEYEYSIDRMLFQVANSRLGRSIAGIGIGVFSSVPENDVKFNEDFPEMLQTWFPKNVNLADGIAVGHVSGSHIIHLGKGIELIPSEE